MNSYECSDTWPNQNVEIKGSSLNESQAAQLIKLVLEYDTVVQFIALDMNTHPDSLVTTFKNRQADNVTANITREHHPGPILHIHQLGEKLRAMSNQLFLQAFATWELIIRTIRDGTLYYVQRTPQELGEIGWFVDRKDRTLTQMEETWSTLILPFSEFAFGREPLSFLKDGDYSYFDAIYGIRKEAADAETLKHHEWLESIYGATPREQGAVLTDAKRLLTEHRMFEDSRSSLGLQLADMLASILRRALNDRLQFEGWDNFGGLLIRHRDPATGLQMLGSRVSISQ
jgi:Protein of unknown function (DUF3800)